MNTYITRETFLKKALSLIGQPSLRYSKPENGTDPEGFDCSGFVLYTLNESGIQVPAHIRHCNEFFDEFGVHLHEECAEYGDLVFFSRNGKRPTHIGVMFDSEHYVHAPGLPNTKVSLTEITRSAPSKSSEQIYFRNPIGFKRISLKCGRWQKLLN